MFSNKIMERFANPKYAGGMRGADGTGKSGNEECGDVIKIYLQVNENEVITQARFKAYGGVCTIVACDVACQCIEGRSVEAALRTNFYGLLEEMGEVPENREYTITLAQEAVRSAIEDYYKKKEKQNKQK